MNENLPVLLSEDGFAQFLIDITEETEYNIDFKVFEVNSWEMDKKHTPRDTELYVSGTIKWDGCSHLWFGEEKEDGTHDGYLHLCGKFYIQKHINMMTALYTLASEKIKKFDVDEKLSAKD
ncbi:MAG: hypothetical protein ACTSYW_00595 [Candidatus Heimdallarchaeota archaeon]